MTEGRTFDPSGRGEMILLVSPEPETRSLTSFMLTRLGYRVAEARHALEAIERYDDLSGGVDLLVTEAVMSRVNGHALAQSLTSRSDRLRVLYLSDATYERMARKVAAQKRLHFLVRPFTIHQLAAKVREALDAPVAVRAARA